jgi:putative ABC transport system permease protein
MIRNYLLTTVRNLRKHLSYSFINISGLALGLATCLLLVTWIRHELSYDRFHDKASRIYRSSLEYSFGGQVARPSVSPNALLPALLTLPETETGVRVYNPSKQSPYIIKYEDKTFEEDRFYFADSTFFDVFSFEVTSGNPKKALTEPYSVIVTEEMAQKYFGDENPLGKTLSVNNRQDYRVTATMKNAPDNSLLQFDFIASFNSIPAGREQPSWWSANYQTFVLVGPNASVSELADKTNEIVRQAVATDLTGESDYVRYNFLPLTDIYLRSEFDEAELVSDIKYTYIFAGVTLLILVIACINYINLATARAASRAREVGIRKVSGALRKQLFAQFIGESLIITAISFALALFIAQALLPLFNQLTGKSFSYSVLLDPVFLAIALAGLLVVAFAAGAYPAVALTGFNPVQVLKGNFKTSARGTGLRKSLVIFQFAISVILITSTLIVIRQLDFMREKKLGYDRENTIVLPLDAKIREVFQALKTELKRAGAASYVGRGSESPANVKAGYSLNTVDKEGPGVITRGLLVDEEFIPTLGMELLAGRNFSSDDVARYNRDSVYSFILNEAALEALYISAEAAAGSKISLMGRKGEIIGVVKDFHFSSLHEPISPLVIFPEDEFEKIFVKLPAGEISQNLEKVRNIFNTLITHRPFDFEFLDQEYASLYQGEQRMGSIATVFATLAIIIACLGLFGLVSFSAEQKRKEIGIRKVLGATASGIVILLTRDFSKLVLVAILAGLPMAYWMMSTFWLSEFAYKAQIGFWPFVIASVICVFIAVGTTAYEAIKASWIDPAETLRNE